MNNILTQQFNIPPDVALSMLSKYYILHWSGKYLIERIYADRVTDKIDCILHQNTDYSPALLNSLSYWKILQSPKTQFALSFRLPKNITSGYVLIKPLKEFSQ